MVFRIAVTIFAVFLILFGIVWTISPIPFGIVVVALGFLLLATVAPAEIRWVRRRWRWFDKAMHKLEEKLPEWIAKRLRVSDYDHAEDEAPPPRAQSTPTKTRRARA